jgi:hypothetical protein
MSETPSSAVTTASVVTTSPSGDGIDLVAVPAMAPAAGSAGAALETTEAAALDDHVPFDLLLNPRGLVEIAPPADAPLYAASPLTDWSGTVHDATRLAAGGAPGLDMVYDGDGDGTHVPADHPMFAVARAGLTSITETVDPLVHVATLSGEPEAFAMAACDAPIHVDVSAGDFVRVDLGAPDLRAPELSWLAAIDGAGVHVGEAWAWSDVAGSYVFDHYV